jgi:flagellar hook-basal body complex protein FliE
MLDSLTSVLSPASTQTRSAAFLGNTQAAKAGATGGAPQDFTSMLVQMFNQTTESLNKAETTSIAAVQGKASVQQVVEAVTAADQSLQVAIAVRDKVTAAYLELSRMSI